MSGDEVISSSYDMIEKDDVVYEVDCQMITKGGESYGMRRKTKLSRDSRLIAMLQILVPMLLLKKSRKVSRMALYKSTTLLMLSDFKRLMACITL